MAGSPTVAIPTGFLGVGREDRDAALVVAWARFDLGTTNWAGTRTARDAFRGHEYGRGGASLRHHGNHRTHGGDGVRVFGAVAGCRDVMC